MECILAIWEPWVSPLAPAFLSGGHNPNALWAVKTANISHMLNLWKPLRWIPPRERLPKPGGAPTLAVWP